MPEKGRGNFCMRASRMHCCYLFTALAPPAPNPGYTPEN